MRSSKGWRSGTPTCRPEYLFVDLSLSSYERESAALLGACGSAPPASSMREMSSRLLALTFDGHDPARLAAFWAGVLVGSGQRQVRNNRVAPAVDLISLMGVLLGPAAATYS